MIDEMTIELVAISLNQSFDLWLPDAPCHNRQRKIRSGRPSETRFGAALQGFFASFSGPRQNQLPKSNGMLLAINLLGTQTYSDLILIHV